MSKNQNPQFAMIPFKLLRLGLDAYAIAAFVALRKHGDKHGRNIRPSWETLMIESGQRRVRLWTSLIKLRELKIIEWETGWEGRANRYHILPIGHWTSSPHEPLNQFATRTGVVRSANGGSSPHEPDLDPRTRSMNYSATASEDSEKEEDGDLRVNPGLLKQYASLTRKKIENE